MAFWESQISVKDIWNVHYSFNDEDQDDGDGLHYDGADKATSLVLEQIKPGPLTINYGRKSNSFLLLQHSFAYRNNPYDYVEV